MRGTLLVAAVLLTTAVASAQGFEKDVIPTSAGDLSITFIGHGSLVFGFAGKTIEVDPFSKLADYGALPKADLILITHAHGDHLDPVALAAVRGPQTQVVVAPDCEGKVGGALVLANGERRTVAGIGITAVPAYNLVHLRPDGTPYHPKGRGNGYLLRFADKRVYVAGRR